MKQRPDGDIEIDEKFWEEDFHIHTRQKCNGVLKPDVRFFCFYKIKSFLSTFSERTHNLTEVGSSMWPSGAYPCDKLAKAPSHNYNGIDWVWSL